jgi:hypothetical protein
LDVALEAVQDNQALSDVLEQFGITEGVLYRIYRQTPTGPSFCYESGEYSPVILQRERGAGAYTIRIFINSKYKKTISENIDAPATGTATSQNPADSHTGFLEKMLMALILKDRDPAPAGPSIIDLTTALSNLDGLRGKQESAMEMFLKGVDLAKTFASDSGGVGDWKTELLKMGREAIPAITSVVQGRVQPPAPDVPAQVQPGQDQTMIDPEQLTDEQQKAMLKDVIRYLKNQFLQGLPPESALDFIIANSGHPQYQAVIKAVLKFKFEEIESLDAEIQHEPFHVCFRTVYDGLRTEFGGDDPVDDDPRGDTGDVADVGSNGGTGKARK